MLKYSSLWFFIIFLLAHPIFGKDVESMESDSASIEIPIKPHKSNTEFSFLKPSDDPVFNFINKLINTAHLSTKMALKRVQTENERRKEFEEQIDDILEKFTPHVPILDDIPKLYG